MHVPVLIVAALLLVAPILAGFFETARAGFGVLPALGLTTPSLAPWRDLAALPGIWTSVKLTLWTGLAATVLSLCLASGFAALIWARVGLGRGGRWLAPVLAAPHAALAIGLGFLLAPSGWLARLVSPWATGWDVPPALATVQDPAGLALILGLVVKETAFLTLVMLAGCAQLPVARHMAAARALGWPPAQAWALVVWPQLYPMIRLPVLVVLSYSLSVVDVALILGPGTPPTLAVAMTRWFLSPDSKLILPASAAALVQAGVVVAAVLAWLGAERALAAARPLFGWRLSVDRGAGVGFAMIGAGLAALLLGVGAVLSLWSVAFRWPYPAAFPHSFTATGWMASAGWGAALGQTLLIAFIATALAVLLAIAWLEGETRRARGPLRAEVLIYVPLLMPQVAFLYGLNVTALRAGLPAGMAAVIWAHVMFCFPYVMIALAGPWRRLDPRPLRAAAALGAGPWRRLVMVRLPYLLRPIAVAAAVGVSVSVAQYLPTLFLGAGRVTTLTTEAVALSSGADRRITAVYALLQALVPLAGFVLAAVVPAAIWANRRGLKGEGVA